MTTLNEEALVDGITRPVTSPLDPPITITPIPIGDPPVVVPAVAAPTNLRASAAQGRVTLTWQDNSNNEDGFRIRRRAQNDADLIDVGEVGPNVTTYVDTTVQPQTTYTYRVRSFRNGGGGGVSNDAVVTTPDNQPAGVAAPTNLQASAAQGRVTLTWQDNSNNEEGFRIRRRGQNDADFLDVAEVGPNVTAFTDTAVQPQMTYTYRVRSFRNGGGGGVSNDATVTTPGTAQRRALSSAAKGGNMVTAGGRISIPVGQFQYFVNDIPTLEFVNASAVLAPPEPSIGISIFPMNPIETFTNVTVTLTTTVDTPARTYDLTVSGQSTDVPGPVGAYPPQTIRVEVLPPPTVTLSVDPMSQSIRVGDSATYQIKLQRSKADGVAIDLEVNEKKLPDGINATIDPPSPTGNSARLTITTDRALVPLSLEGIELRIRSKTAGVKVIPATAQLRFKPEVTFTAMPAMDTVPRGGSKKFRVTAMRRYYNGALKLDLSVRGNRPSFTPTIRPDANGSDFEVELKIGSDTTPGDYTFVATPQFPKNVTDGIPTEATFMLRVENAVVMVRVTTDQAVNLKRGKKSDVNLEIDPSTFVGPVSVELLMGELPSGVTAKPPTLELKRGGGSGAEVFSLEANDNAFGSGSLGFRGTVSGMPDVTVEFMPKKLPVNVLSAGTVIVATSGALPVYPGEAAEFVVTLEAVEYSGMVQIQVANAPGPVTFENNVDTVSLGPPRSGRVRFSVATDALEPNMKYPFQILAAANPAAQLPNLPLTTQVVVIPRPDRTMQPPAIGNFVPKSGRGGDVITISGTGFVANTTRVSLAGVNADIVSLAETELRVRIPANASSGQFTVQTPNGSVTSRDSFTVAALAPSLAAPTDLRATLAGQQVNLRWNDNSDEEGFRIERRAMDGGYQPIATVPRGATSFADASATAGATYFYRVRAFAGAVESLPSNEIGVSVPLPQAAASVWLSVAPVSQRVLPGGIATVTVALARMNYAGPVVLAVDGLPFGAIATFSDDPATGNSSILTVAAGETGPGFYRLGVRGTANGVNIEPAFLTVNVAAPTRPTGPVRPFPFPRPRPEVGLDLRPGFPTPDMNLDPNS